MKKEIEIKKVVLVQGSTVRRHTLDKKALPFQMLKLAGVYYSDGLLALHKVQYLKEGDIKEK